MRMRGGGEAQKTLKHIHATAYKRKEFDNEQKFLRLKDSPLSPITFLIVRPLLRQNS